LHSLSRGHPAFCGQLNRSSNQRPTIDWHKSGWFFLWDKKITGKEATMLRGDKSSYTGKQKRQAEHIEKGYESRGTGGKEAKRRAWATVNKMTHGGKKSGSGRGTKENHSPARKGGRLGGRARKRS
jgi:hypothetical protein